MTKKLRNRLRHKHHAAINHPSGDTATVGHGHLPPRRRLKNGLSTVGILLLAPIIALFLTAFVFQSYQVDGPSMESTLNPDDRLIILKTPRTWAKITGHTYIPERGEIIVFNKQDIDNFNGQSGTKQLIKRVIGLPGERVVVRDNQLTIYSNEHPDGFNPDRALEYGSVVRNTPGNIDITVPEGELFVCGDNRPNSLDSRVFGPIPAKDVIGKVGFRILPLSEAKHF